MSKSHRALESPKDELLRKYGAGKRDFVGLDLYGIVLREVDLTGINLSKANLRMARIVLTNLSGATLRETDLSGANLKGSNLSGADLTRANLMDAYLAETNLDRAILVNAVLSGATYDTLSGAILYEEDARIREVIERPKRSIPKEVQREVWRRDGGRCVECGSKVNLEFDHIIPLSEGGSNTARNIQLLCEPCNRRKSNKVGG